MGLVHTVFLTPREHTALLIVMCFAWSIYYSMGGCQLIKCYAICLV